MSWERGNRLSARPAPASPNPPSSASPPLTTKKRFAALSELPTVAEALGLPDYEAVNWQGLLFPVGTPQPVIARIAGETIKILALPDTRARLDVLGYEPSGPTPQEFAALMRVEQKRWTAIIKEAGITAD